MAVARAVRGEPSAVVLRGEPGVGKTRLVTDAVEALADSHVVLWARFPRFSSDSTALLPVAQALSRWSRSAPEQARTAAFTDAGDLAAILPELGPSRPVDGGRLTSLLTAVIHRIGEVKPVVLVADDLQWADTSSLDMLAYLIAGFGPGQHLTLLATYRDTELGMGRFIEWVADMRRMPGVTVQALERLDLVETVDLVHDLVSNDSHQGDQPDAEAIFERSLGNPYLTELLVADPVTGGASIEEALLASWHRLDSATRTLTQIIAIGGRPVPLDVLVTLARGSNLGRRKVLAGVDSAVAAGLATVSSGAVWFRHPLVAEVIAGSVAQPAATAWHKDYVRVLEHATALPNHARAALLALHHEAAGHSDAAFRWSIVAADAAASVRATAEETENLLRAVRLWPDAADSVRSSVRDHAALLERASLAADYAGQFATAQRLAEDAVRAVDSDAEPLRASRMLITLPLGLDPQESFEEQLARTQAAHLLAERCDPSEELALTLAMRSYAELWCDVPGAVQRAEAAMLIAEQVESPVALAMAHLIHSQFHWDSPQGAAEALAAWEQLRQHGGVLDWGLRNMMVLNCLEGLGRFDALVDHGQRVLRDLTSAGAPAIGVAQGTTVSHYLVRLGRWRQARKVLQSVLAQRQHPRWALDARATAARLCAQSGDLQAARRHFARVEELLTVTPLGTFWGGARVEVLWADGEFARASDVAIDLMPQVAPLDPDAADELYLWGARSIADLAEARMNAPGAILGNLDRLDVARATGPVLALQREPEDRIHPAMAALVAAERARCRRAPDQVERWRVARDAAAAASLAWEAGWAGYQLGRALLAGRGHRQEAGDIVRSAYQEMVQLGAQPLAERIRLLATQAHLPLRESVTDGATDAPKRAAWEIDGLTPREREVLEHVVAGSTYAQIARDLFISEKTVGVHVSNLLRKTGTSSRIELADLATTTRTGMRRPASSRSMG